MRNMREEVEVKMEKIVQFISNLSSTQIKEILVKNVYFSVEPKILFYTKINKMISGYLSVEKKEYYFEINVYYNFNGDDYTIMLKIGKITIMRHINELGDVL